VIGIVGNSGNTDEPHPHPLRSRHRATAGEALPARTRRPSPR
jgi:hypothetical protein